MRPTITLPRRRRPAADVKTALALHINALLGPAGHTPAAGLDPGGLIARHGLDDVAAALRDTIHATLARLAQHRGAAATPDTVLAEYLDHACPRGCPPPAQRLAAQLRQHLTGGADSPGVPPDLQRPFVAALLCLQASAHADLIDLRWPVTGLPAQQPGAHPHRSPTGYHRARPDRSIWPTPPTARTSMHDPLTPALYQRGPVASGAAGPRR